MHWRAFAACEGMDPDLFFPVTEDEEAAPKAVCQRCPVAEECLAYAMTKGEKWGIWGGLTPKERSQLRRQQAVAWRKAG